MASDRKDLRPGASDAELDAFLRQVAQTPRRGARPGGRLIFAMDATASREPTWDSAGEIQAAMFNETANLGGLAIQLCFYRGFGEFEASAWFEQTDALLRRMTRVRCAAGLTQIGRVLRHALDERKRGRVDALVFVGDAVEENPDRIADLAGKLGMIGLPAFVFQEGGDRQAEKTLRAIARLSGGAYCPFDASSPGTLRELLTAVAVFAAGGRAALEEFGRTRGGAALRLTHQVTRG